LTRERAVARRGTAPFFTGSRSPLTGRTPRLAASRY